MKILVTGGDGYIGTNFIKRYHTMHDIDICDYGIEHPGNDGLHDLAQDLSLEYIEKFDGIIHFAALSGIAACEKNWIEAVEKNILTAQNIFSKAALRNIPVVFTSSQAAKNPLSSRYASLKATCEGLAKIYGSVYVIRLANVYGGKGYLEKKQTCIKQFVTKYKNGDNLIIHGTGLQKRDFIHVYDVCDAIMKILTILPEDKSPMDIGTGKGTSIMDLAKMFPNASMKQIDERNTGTESSIANVFDAAERIHFIANRNLKHEIRRMIL